jgi:cytochrome c/uncharacterized membrane protein YfcA
VTAIGLALALAVGLSLGLLGGGGSVLTVPIFVYVMGFDPKQAIGMAFVVVGVVSLIAAAGHWRAGRVDPRLALMFGAIAMVASYAAATMAWLISGTAQLVLLAIVICVAAGFMFRNATRAPLAAAPAAGVPSLLQLAPIALGVGTLTGLVGVGGGFLIVPALVLVGRVPIKPAIGTSLVVIMMNCAAGLLGYLRGGGSISWGTVLAFTTVAAAGTLAGARLCGFVSPARLNRGFAVLLLGVGAFVLSRNWQASRTVPLTVVPPDTAITDPAVRRGQALLAHTADSLPENALSGLNCLSCHLDAGRHAGAAPLIGTYARYPRYIERTGGVASVEDRVNYCLKRSLAGRPLDASSPAMHDMVSYLRWLSTGVPSGAHVQGEGMPKMPALTGDPARGARMFGATCARCHGDSGQGTAVAPPLWGPRAFSVGASMAREERAASFIRHNMPLDRPGSLTDQQAFDLAAFVNAHPRPDLAEKARDWPKGGAPYDVPYATLGHTAYRPPPLIARQ